MTRIGVLVFFLAYAAVVLTTFAADRFSAAGKVDLAIRLDPGNAEYYSQKYELLEQNNSQLTIHHLQKKQLSLIKRAIDLRPTWPKYHVLYAHTLGRMSRKPNFMTRRVILSELKKAIELKPYSPKYRKIYEKYVNSYE